MYSRFVLLILLLAVTSVRSAYACLNGDQKTLKNGELLYADYEGRVPLGHSFFFRHGAPETIRAIHELDSLYRVTRDADYLSDKGLLLIITGRYAEAIALYLELERITPGRYATASNMGAAYELAGNNEEALKWIRRAVAINPASHHHSEWIHVNILEAKIRGASYVRTQHLLDTDFGTADVPVSSLGADALDSLADALYFQLNERMSFVKPKDAIVAQLLHDLGDIEYLLGNRNDAARDYKLAARYGYRQAPEEPLKDAAGNERVWEKPEHDAPNRFPVVISGAIVVLLAVVIIAARRRRKND